jgi:hypothetical protein
MNFNDDEEGQLEDAASQARRRIKVIRLELFPSDERFFRPFARTRSIGISDFLARVIGR